MRKSNKTNQVKHFKGHFLITLQSVHYVNKALLHKSYYPPLPPLWLLEEMAKIIQRVPFSLNTNIK